MQTLDGRGSFIGLILGGVLGLLYVWKPTLMPAELWGTLATIIGTFTGFRFRLAIRKAEAKVDSGAN